MSKILPQEIEVWYLIPSLRKELAKIFINDYQLTQKEAADVIGVTDAAISQYLKSKRANELKFSKPELEIIKGTAKVIMKDSKSYMKHFYNLCVALRATKSMCDFHKKYDKSVPEGCKICLEH